MPKESLFHKLLFHVQKAYIRWYVSSLQSVIYVQHAIFTSKTKLELTGLYF